LSGIDIGLAVFILLGAYHGYKAGFLLELFSLFAVVLGVLLGFKLMGSAMLLLANRLDTNEKFLPYIAFVAVFIVVVIVVGLLGKLISASVNRTFLGSVDQAAGGILGLLRTTFMFSVVLWIVDSLKLGFFPNWTDGSRLYPIVADVAPTLAIWISGLLPMFGDVF
jgi:membrane protein required for colicin V production